MKRNVLLPLLIALCASMFCDTSYSQKKIYVEEYRLMTSYEGVDIYARWSMPCDWCTEGVDVKIVNNNNGKIKLSYEVVFQNDLQTIWHRGQAIFLEPGQTQQRGADWSFAGLRYDAPNGYAKTGDPRTGISFNVRNILVKRADF